MEPVDVITVCCEFGVVRSGMTADVISRPLRRRRRGGGLLWLPFAALAAIVIAAGCFVSYVLWPTWPGKAIPLDAPALPCTVGGVLFDVPPAAIRAAVQRQPGPHERVDLVFCWPSLAPPAPFDQTAAKPAGNAAADPAAENVPAQDAVAPSARDRLFVTIAGLGDVLPPLERLRTIYPRYVEAAATAGPDGLACSPFAPARPMRRGLLYAADNPEHLRPLQPCGPRGAGHLPAGARARRRRDQRAVSARTVEEGGPRPLRLRSARGAAASRRLRGGSLVSRGLLYSDRSRGSPSGNCRSVRRPRRRRTARRRLVADIETSAESSFFFGRGTTRMRWLVNSRLR